MTIYENTAAEVVETNHEDIEHFAARLRLLIGDRSVRSFAREVGVSDKMLRQYLAARSEPTRRVLLAIAKAGGNVSLDWLISGGGEMVGSSRSGSTREARTPELFRNINQFPQQRPQPTKSNERWISAKEEFVAWLNQWWRDASPRERAWLEVQLEAYVPQFVSWRKQLRKKMS